LARKCGLELNLDALILRMKKTLPPPATVVLEPRPKAPRLGGDDPVGACACSVIAFHLQNLKHEQDLAASGDAEGLHQMRVAIRKLRAALRLFASVLPPSIYSPAQRDLAWAGRTVGAVRDIDVIAQTLNDEAVHLETFFSSALAPIETEIRERRAATLAAAIAMLDSARYRNLLDRLETISAVGATSYSKLRDVAPAMVAPMIDSVLRAARKIDSDAAAEDLHALRIRVKRLRYGLEPLPDVARKSLTRDQRRLASLQDLLGWHQDVVMSIEWLRNYAKSSDRPAATLVAVGALIHALGTRRRRLSRDAAESLGQLDKLGANAIRALDHTQLHPRNRVRPSK
jgi:CHAD domain-containing protein